jgi:hypothetical protein
MRLLTGLPQRSQTSLIARIHRPKVTGSISCHHRIEQRPIPLRHKYFPHPFMPGFNLRDAQGCLEKI